ncbi:MAG: transglycosylase SLT domain-containing protein [Aureispira sp.]|nr:transglycosylase SLT domain-containing protein [Aureispira sp.]
MRLYHSIDRVLTELLFVFQWFNPFMYWFRKDLIAVHEYQVDSEMLGAGTDSILYQQLIVKYASLSNSYYFGNHFSQSLTLNRIKMIANNKSFSPYQSFRILVLIPVAFALLCLFSFQRPTSDITKKKQPTNFSNNITTPPIPEKVDFAGEALPLDNFDAKERFDRELISNTFRHSSTLLFLKKSSRYFPIIEPILKEYGVPNDFKYLAVGESALSNAVSPAGAKGFWQFMPKTAEAYGLEVSKEVDERYHLEKSTIAACQYLKKAYDQFGSWTLAAAAYNMGGPGLQKTIETQGGETYFDLYLNKETSRYMLRIMAIKTIMENPSDYGFDLSREDYYPPLPEFKTLKMEESISDLTAYAKEHDVSYRMLKIYNPWLVGGVLSNKDGKEYKIRIPIN